MPDGFLDRFDFSAYRELLTLFRSKNANVRFADFPLPSDSERFFILRHDVDYCPQRALDLAMREADWGFRASYCFLLRDSNYNLLSPDFCRIPKRIADLGHEICLHYDLQPYEALGEENLAAALLQDVEILSTLAGTEVRTIAQHNPSCDGDPFRGFPGLRNTYDPPYTEGVAYFSDSHGAWRTRTRRILESGDLPARVHLLIHPIFWGPERGDGESRIRAYEREKVARLGAEMEAILRVWRRRLGSADYRPEV